MSRLEAETLANIAGSRVISMEMNVRGTPKCHGLIQYTAGTPSSLLSNNVSSLTDIGTGVCGVNLTLAMTSSNFPALVTVNGSAVLNNLDVETRNGGVVTALFYPLRCLSPAGVATDPNQFSHMALGD